MANPDSETGKELIHRAIVRLIIGTLLLAVGFGLFLFNDRYSSGNKDYNPGTKVAFTTGKVYEVTDPEDWDSIVSSDDIKESGSYYILVDNNGNPVVLRVPASGAKELVELYENEKDDGVRVEGKVMKTDKGHSYFLDNLALPKADRHLIEGKDVKDIYISTLKSDTAPPEYIIAISGIGLVSLVMGIIYLITGLFIRSRQRRKDAMEVDENPPHHFEG